VVDRGRVKVLPLENEESDLLIMVDPRAGKPFSYPKLLRSLAAGKTQEH
jgi:hypothetical protein